MSLLRCLAEQTTAHCMESCAELHVGMKKNVKKNATPYADRGSEVSSRRRMTM